MNWSRQESYVENIQIKTYFNCKENVYEKLLLIITPFSHKVLTKQIIVICFKVYLKLLLFECISMISIKISVKKR